MTRPHRLPTAPITEKQFQSAVLKLARHTGWLCYHTFDSRRSQPGFPDLVMVRDGEIVFAELKSEKGKLTDAQRRWLTDLDMAGAETHVWRPSQLQATSGQAVAAGARCIERAGGVMNIEDFDANEFIREYHAAPNPAAWLTETRRQVKHWHDCMLACLQMAGSATPDSWDTLQPPLYELRIYYDDPRRPVAIYTNDGVAERNREG